MPDPFADEIVYAKHMGIRNQLAGSPCPTLAQLNPNECVRFNHWHVANIVTACWPQCQSMDAAGMRACQAV